jgi:hypothetical protein
LALQRLRPVLQRVRRRVLGRVAPVVRSLLEEPAVRVPARGRQAVPRQVVVQKARLRRAEASQAEPLWPAAALPLQEPWEARPRGHAAVRRAGLSLSAQALVCLRAAAY